MNIELNTQEYAIVKRAIDILYQNIYRDELKNIGNFNVITNRDKLINYAYSLIGIKENTEEWKEKILNVYNSQVPLPVGYRLKENDGWCAAFITVLAIKTDLKHILPCECSVERMAKNFKNMGRFYDSNSTPFSGDIIFYDWQDDKWHDHCGLVVGQNSNLQTLYVIEGNKNNKVALTEIPINSCVIAGYGRPVYESEV